MWASHHDALICDFAETYHIYDIEGLPASYAATLASGLRHDSRTVMEMSGQKVKTDTWLMAAITDAVQLLWWSKTKNGAKNRKKPVSIVRALTEAPRKKEVAAFDTATEFEKARERMLRKINGSRN